MPFLDHRLVELVWTLPAGFKIKLGVGKHLHREAMRGTVPDWILNKKMKFGFSTPIREIFKTPMSDGAHPLVVLLDKSCCSRGLFDPFHLRAIIEKHWTGQKDHGPLLFRILSVELWFRKFIDMKGNLAQEI
jgi:asparagine synthase (glutamine-hydrolysing)